MSAIDQLTAAQSQPDADTAARQLAALLDLESVGLEIRGARVVGKGSRASCDVYLSDGSTMTFERMSDVCKAPALAAELVACTGALPKLKTADALNAARLIRLVAEHHDSATADDIAIEWGASFLREATTLDVDLGDQGQRWGAFARLKDTSPWSQMHLAGGTIAAHCIVLRHLSGERLVRCSWFAGHVKSRESATGTPEIAQRMARVGWERRGGRGRVKATHPARPEHLAFAFHIVRPGWEDESGHTGTPGVPVSAGVPSSTRARNDSASRVGGDTSGHLARAVNGNGRRS
jgi:hypothetical protein